jgi:hypothetical protein
MQKHILRLFVSVVSLLVAAPSWAQITPLPLKSTLAATNRLRPSRQLCRAKQNQHAFIIAQTKSLPCDTGQKQNGR